MKIKQLLTAFGLSALAFGFQSCEKEDPTPISATVNSITVSQFPMTDSFGDGWDLTTNPDIYTTIGTGTTISASVYSSPTYFTDASSPGTYTFSGGFPIQLAIGSTYNVGVWDLDDLDADDVIGGLSFTPLTAYTSSSSNNIQLTGGSFVITLNVTWNF
jgi:hypothetical protein